MSPFIMQTYTQRKVSKERASEGEGIEHGRDRGSNMQSPKMALPQFEREQRNYKPSELNALSKCHEFRAVSGALVTQHQINLLV